MAPIIKIPRNVMTVRPEKTIGKMRATSISNTKKITETIKNFMQNGSRVIPLGSNPHSKGDAFSLSTIDFSVIKDRARRADATKTDTTP